MWGVIPANAFVSMEIPNENIDISNKQSKIPENIIDFIVLSFPNFEEDKLKTYLKKIIAINNCMSSLKEVRFKLKNKLKVA